MDHWIKVNHDLNFDKNGKWAKKGQIIDDLLKYFLNDNFLKRSLQKVPGETYLI
jgi:1,6-anhydro-N-acetylmuramate kinase